MCKELVVIEGLQNVRETVVVAEGLDNVREDGCH